MHHHVSVVELVGQTPMVELRHLSPRPEVRLFAKLEGMNPTGSIKDRIVVRMLEQAHARDGLRRGDTIIEASTGNTGIALAMIGRAMGYKIEVVMPENVYPEIPRMLDVYGACVHFIPPEQGVHGAIAVARDMARREGWLFLDQFGNQANSEAHYESTAAEILADLPRVDLFVAGLGTGGTLMGIGRRLKEANPETRVVAVEPHPGYQVQGLKSLADGFVPPILDLQMLDGKILVGSHNAFLGARELMRREGIFAGISSGAVLHGALTWVRRLERGNVVMVFADSGWKYLDTNMWTETPSPESGEEMDDIIWW